MFLEHIGTPQVLNKWTDDEWLTLLFAKSFYEWPKEAVYHNGFVSFDYYLISLGLNFSHLYIGIIISTLQSYFEY